MPKTVHILGGKIFDNEFLVSSVFRSLHENLKSFQWDYVLPAGSQINCSTSQRRQATL